MGTGNTLSLVSTAGASAHFRFSYQESFRAFRIVPRAAESLSLTASGSALVLQSASGSAAQIFIAESASRSLGTSYTYQDNGNYLSTVTDDKGNTLSYTYDTAKGLLQSVTDAKGNVTSYTYNSAQRLSKVAAGGSEVTYTYNAAGDLIGIGSPSGASYSFTFDSFMNPASVRVGNTALASYTYEDGYGNLQSVTRADGTEIRYVYDDFGRLVEEQIDEIPTFAYTYDLAGNLVELRDFREDSTTLYTYDLAGRVVSARKSDGSYLRYYYDGEGRVSATEYGGELGGAAVEYGYGSAISGQKEGLPYSVRIGGTQYLSYAYDELSRLQSRTLNAGAGFVTTYTYHDGSDPSRTTSQVKTLQNGSDTLEYAYDAAGNISNGYLRSSINGLVDGAIDVFQTIAYFTP